MMPRLSFFSKQQTLANLHLMLISPCPWLSASVRITEPVYPTQISREDQGSMRVIACQDLQGESVKLTLTSASLFHVFEVRRPMSIFSKILRGMWIFIYSSFFIFFSSRWFRRLIRNIGHDEKSHKREIVFFILMGKYCLDCTERLKLRSKEKKWIWLIASNYNWKNNNWKYNNSNITIFTAK